MADRETKKRQIYVVALARFCNLYFAGFQLVRDVDLKERTTETNTHTIERNSSQII
jgi:hypothetical protein